MVINVLHVFFCWLSLCMIFFRASFLCRNFFTAVFESDSRYIKMTSLLYMLILRLLLLKKDLQYPTVETSYY